MGAEGPGNHWPSTEAPKLQDQPPQCSSPAKPVAVGDTLPRRLCCPLRPCVPDPTPRTALATSPEWGRVGGNWLEQGEPATVPLMSTGSVVRGDSSCHFPFGFKGKCQELGLRSLTPKGGSGSHWEGDSARQPQRRGWGLARTLAEDHLWMLPLQTAVPPWLSLGDSAWVGPGQPHKDPHSGSSLASRNRTARFPGRHVATSHHV